MGTWIIEGGRKQGRNGKDKEGERMKENEIKKGLKRGKGLKK